MGPSPYVAKGLVLCFSLTAGLYLLTWLRRWISPYAGWVAGMLLLLPGVVRWSHAIMLNLPSLALGLGALYHARRWQEAPGARRGHLLAAALLTVLGILTYYPTGVVIFVIIAWFGVRGEWHRWLDPRALAMVGGGVVILLPFTWLISHWAPVQLGWVLPTASDVATLSNWTYYPSRLPQLVGAPGLGFAAVGAAAGVLQPRWRRETIILTSWILVFYVVFSLLHAKDPRYALPVLVPIVGLAVIGLLAVGRQLTNLVGPRLATHRWLTTVVLLTAVAHQGYLAAGFQPLVAFLDRVAPGEPVLYDGYHDGVFTFYMRAGDDDFRRRVVLGSKLLYAFGQVPGWRQRDLVNSPAEVVETLHERGGCRWVAIEVSARDTELAPMEYLRDAVQASAFELVRSFPIDGLAIDRVDLYRLTVPVADVQDVDLPFPSLGSDVTYRVRPIESRGADNATGSR